MPLTPLRARRARWIALAVLAGLVGVPGAGNPGSGIAFATSAAASAGEKEARERFQHAEISFNLGKFAEALADYQAAYEIKPLPALLFNVAQCYRNLRDYERARFFYRRYLSLNPRTANRRLVEDLINQMTRRLEKDGASTSASASPSIAAAHEDLAPARLDLAPPASSPAPTLALSTQTTADTAQQTHPVYRRWWFWTGIGALAVGSAAVAFFATRADTPRGSLGTIDGR